MKLELKHLAPYLPYKLKALSIDGFSVSILGVDFTTNRILNINGDRTFTIAEIKPLLRQLSDLTKEIEINGEKFVPIVRLFNAENQNFTFRFDTKGLIKHMKRTILFATSEDDGVEEEVGYLSHNHKNMFYSQFEKLVEWHFDVFGLIDQGLALPLI